jgi:hypothetical protein
MRLNKQREEELQPERVKYAKAELEKKGYLVTQVGDTELQFMHKGELVRLFPYSGWHSGKSIKDGRGLKKLLNQL